MTEAKTRGPTASGEVLRQTVTRAALERTKGASSLHTFGYRDLAEFLVAGLTGALAERLTKIVGAVLDKCFDPVSLLELEVARRHGLDWMRQQQAGHTGAWKALLQQRPATVREMCSIRLPPLPLLYGLDTIWGYSYADVAAQTRPATKMTDEEWLRRVWNDGKPDRAGFSIERLDTVVAYVARHQKPAVLRALELAE